MRALILAQGDGRRWQRPDGSLPLGVPKHLVQVDGQSLVERIVGQLSERGVSDIVVVGPDEDQYRVAGARLVTLNQPHPTATSMDKLIGTRELWAEEDRTTILWGDCYYSSEAMDLIVACDSADPHWFRRPWPSEITGHKWDESFAFSFLPEHHEDVHDLADLIADTVPARKIHMWRHYAGQLGQDPATARIRDYEHTPHQTVIDDFTDDIDSWAEWCAWMGRYHAGRVPLAVCIPWWDTGCPWRQASAEWTEKYWRDLGVPVVYGTGESRSAARNDAARTAIGQGAEVLVFTDADTIVPAHQLWAAAHLARESDRLVPAYVTHVRMDRASTTRRLRQDPGRSLPRRGREVQGSASGCIAISAGSYIAVGGHDERFIAWGGEDRAFQYACDTLLGPGERIHGRSFHLWHPPSESARKGDPGRAENVALALRYKEAAGYRPVAGVLGRTPSAEPCAESVRAILAEPGGPYDTWR